MVLEQLINSPWYAYLILPLLIFFGRIIDVSVGTIRLIFVARGFRKIAPILAFFEIMVWLLVARQVLTDLTNVVAYFAYAGGFTAGTYIGMIIEERLSVGKVMLRIITGDRAENLIKQLEKRKYGLTVTLAKGPEGSVKEIFSVMDRKELSQAIEIIKKFNPRAFYAVEDIRFAHETGHAIHHRKKPVKVFDTQRKGK